MTNDQQPGADEAAPSAGGPAPIAPGAMRVGDTERNSALEALGEHLTAGRITLDEYGDRSAKITVARTADDLSALFDDLPAPHPVLPAMGVTSILSATASPASLASSTRAAEMPPARGVARPGGDTRSTAQKLVGAAAAASVFVAVALFFITGHWWWFLLIPAISAVAGSIWGPDWKEPRPAVGPGGVPRQLRDDRRDHHRELRDQYRGRRRELRGRDRDRP